MSAQEASTQAAVPTALPKSDVSGGVGLAGLLGLFVWILFCRTFPFFADLIGLEGEYGVLSGPHAALMAMVFTAGPMAIWSVLVDRVHLRPSTGLDWSLKRTVEEVMPVSYVKIAGLWATWLIIAGLYCVGRWYWDGSYLFAMQVLGYAILPMVVLSVPYIVWLDRYMIDQKDSTWHFGAMLIGRGEWDVEAIKKHWRAWIIKAFFGAFMISIVPPGFAIIVEAQPSQILNDPVLIGMLLVNLLFPDRRSDWHCRLSVHAASAGCAYSFRHPFLGGWLAALLCYPPFVWGIIGNNNQILSYESNVAGWGHWFAGNEPLLWFWAGWLIFLTAIYAWATVAFGIRFSNLTYRGVLTNGPYRFTRHPAYLSKNLFWWCSVMPFLVTSGSPVDVVRNTFFLLVVNAIYYWRARTEEAHLLGEDAKYREYYDWMEANGLITAPLARIKRRFAERFSGQGRQKDPGANGAMSHPDQQPAE